MRIPPFLLDQWLATYEFASPPIRYNLASSTGPRWTLGVCSRSATAESEGSRQSAPRRTRRRRSDALRKQVAALHDVDPDWVVITTGASKRCLRSTVWLQSQARRSRCRSRHFPRCPSWRARGPNVATYASIARMASSNPLSVCSLRWASTRLVLVNTPHNPTGSGCRRRSRAAGRESRTPIDSARGRRGVSPALSRWLAHTRRRCRTRRRRRSSKRSRSPACVSLVIDRDARRRDG